VVTGTIILFVDIPVYKKKIVRFQVPQCEARSLTLRDRYRPFVLEHKLLSKIFGAKRDEVTGEWRRLITKRFVICTSDKISFG
jgi:hypothetical protein